MPKDFGELIMDLLESTPTQEDAMEMVRRAQAGEIVHMIGMPCIIKYMGQDVYARISALKGTNIRQAWSTLEVTTPGGSKFCLGSIRVRPLSTDEERRKFLEWEALPNPGDNSLYNNREDLLKAMETMKP